MHWEIKISVTCFTVIFIVVAETQTQNISKVYHWSLYFSRGIYQCTVGGICIRTNAR